MMQRGQTWSDGHAGVLASLGVGRTHSTCFPRTVLAPLVDRVDQEVIDRQRKHDGHDHGKIRIENARRSLARKPILQSGRSEDTDRPMHEIQRIPGSQANSSERSIRRHRPANARDTADMRGRQAIDPSDAASRNRRMRATPDQSPHRADADAD